MTVRHAPDPADRNGEPSEDDWRWEFPYAMALILIGALVVLVVGLIWLLAASFPTQGPYSDRSCTRAVLTQ